MKSGQQLAVVAGVGVGAFLLYRYIQQKQIAVAQAMTAVQPVASENWVHLTPPPASPTTTPIPAALAPAAPAKAKIDPVLAAIQKQARDAQAAAKKADATVAANMAVIKAKAAADACAPCTIMKTVPVSEAGQVVFRPILINVPCLDFPCGSRIPYADPIASPDGTKWTQPGLVAAPRPHHANMKPEDCPPGTTYNPFLLDGDPNAYPCEVASGVSGFGNVISMWSLRGWR